MKLSKRAQNIVKRHVRETFDSIDAELTRHRVYMSIAPGSLYSPDGVILKLTGDTYSLGRKRQVVVNALCRQFGYSRVGFYPMAGGLLLVAWK